MRLLAPTSTRARGRASGHVWSREISSGPLRAALAELIPPVAVRLRRDFAAVLELIRAHALLHQASRQRDAHSRIVATIDDYRVVRDLLGEVLATGVEASVPKRIRETVDALRGMSDEHGVTISKLARELHLDKSSTSRRVRDALERGYLVNDEQRPGRPYRLQVGADMPDDRELLPDPDELPDPEVLHGCGPQRGTMPPSLPDDAGDGLFGRDGTGPYGPKAPS